MNRTKQTNEMVNLVKAEIEKITSTVISCRSRVKAVPFYDRSTLVDVTTHTVLHNLVFGCILVFLIQWIFLGDLRSAIIVGMNIPLLCSSASSSWWPPGSRPTCSRWAPWTSGSSSMRP